MVYAVLTVCLGWILNCTGRPSKKFGRHSCACRALGVEAEPVDRMTMWDHLRYVLQVAGSGYSNSLRSREQRTRFLENIPNLLNVLHHNPDMTLKYICRQSFIRIMAVQTFTDQGGQLNTLLTDHSKFQPCGKGALKYQSRYCKIPETRCTFKLYNEGARRAPLLLSKIPAKSMNESNRTKCSKSSAKTRSVHRIKWGITIIKGI